MTQSLTVVMGSGVQYIHQPMSVHINAVQLTMSVRPASIVSSAAGSSWFCTMRHTIKGVEAMRRMVSAFGIVNIL